MKNVVITGVPEHFNYPIVKAIDTDALSLPCDWEYSPGGTGEMIEKLAPNQVDVAIMLTEGFIKATSVNQLNFKCLDFYISSPLYWGIHTGANSTAKDVKDLVRFPVLISRPNSGSHLMTRVLQSKYDFEGNLEFIEVGNLDGAATHATKNNDFIFLWESLTTAKHPKSNYFKRLGELPTPWPAFVIAVGPAFLEKYEPAEILEFRTSIKMVVQKLSSSDNALVEISNFSDIPEETLLPWFQKTEWMGIPNPELVLKNTFVEMQKLGLLEQRLNFPSQICFS